MTTTHATVRNTLAEALATPGRVVYSVELVPAGGCLDRLYRFAEAARGSDVDVVLSDGVGGSRVPSPDLPAAEVARIMDRQPVVTVTCRNGDRDQLRERLAALYQSGLRNVFAVTGDYPRGVPPGQFTFDLDSVGLLLAISALEAGLDFPSLRPGTAGPLRGLVAGAAVSPFKYADADIWGQRIKTWKKWRAGASFLITQIGFDVKKFHELRSWMAHDGMGHVPVLGYVYFLHAGRIAPFAGGHVPGVYLPPDLRFMPAAPPQNGRTGAQRAPAGNKAAARRRAALLADVLVRGLGYRGVHFGGFGSYDDLAETLAIVQDLAGRDWRENYDEYRTGGGPKPLRFAPDEAFYLFPKEGDGLLRDGPMQQADRTDDPRPSPWLPWVHRQWSEPDGAGAPLLR
ncbi:MAG: methylenetetrahydrofolate reductase [Chloroflexi bacterium]|nr:methylenetetrahydrofolate reductase [Chloroflexota bacterium]